MLQSILQIKLSNNLQKEFENVQKLHIYNYSSTYLLVWSF